MGEGMQVTHDMASGRTLGTDNEEHDMRIRSTDIHINDHLPVQYLPAHFHQTAVQNLFNGLMHVGPLLALRSAQVSNVPQPPGVLEYTPPS
jgi:hypothetical protein